MNRKKLFSVLLDIFYGPLRLVFSAEQLDMMALTQSFSGRNQRPIFQPPPSWVVNTIVGLGLDTLASTTGKLLATADNPLAILLPCCSEGDLIEGVLQRIMPHPAQLVAVEEDPFQMTRAHNRFRFDNRFKAKHGIVARGNMTSSLAMEECRVFDLVLLCPPFEDARYRGYLIGSSYRLKEKGAVMVAVIPRAAFDRISLPSIRFRRWLQSQRARVLPLGMPVKNYPADAVLVIIHTLNSSA